jgi:hypothetical protein
MHTYPNPLLTKAKLCYHSILLRTLGLNHFKVVTLMDMYCGCSDERIKFLDIIKFSYELSSDFNEIILLM